MQGSPPSHSGTLAKRMRVWLQLARSARDSMVAHRVRTLLGMLGFVIGVGGIIAVQGVSAGFEKGVRAFVQSLGSKTLHVTDSPLDDDRPEEDLTPYRPIRLADAKELSNALTTAAAVVPYAAEYLEADSPFRVEIGDQKVEVEVIGTTEAWLQLRTATVARGRFLAPAEVSAGRPVAVVSAWVEGLMRENRAQLTLNGSPLEVVGAFSSRAVFADDAQDKFIVVPLALWANAFQVDRSIVIGVVPREQTSLSMMRLEIERVLRAARGLQPGTPNDFSIVEPEKVMNIERRIIEVITSLTGVLAVIVLIVSGGGIMSVVYVAVAERQKEMGVLQALGMRPSHIVAQLVMESVFVSLGGAIGGVSVGWLLTSAIRAVFGMPAAMTLWMAAVACAYCIATGLLAGLLPALRAGRMTPAECLRDE